MFHSQTNVLKIYSCYNKSYSNRKNLTTKDISDISLRVKDCFVDNNLKNKICN